MKNPRYWICIIGPVPDENLPEGADLPPRLAAQDAICRMTEAGFICSSGWRGHAEYRKVLKALLEK